MTDTTTAAIDHKAKTKCAIEIVDRVLRETRNGPRYYHKDILWLERERARLVRELSEAASAGAGGSRAMTR
jgi:hypothetical protein